MIEIDNLYVLMALDSALYVARYSEYSSYDTLMDENLVSVSRRVVSAIVAQLIESPHPHRARVYVDRSIEDIESAVLTTFRMAVQTFASRPEIWSAMSAEQKYAAASLALSPYKTTPSQITHFVEVVEQAIAEGLG
jgi:hypothetical protein